MINVISTKVTISRNLKDFKFVPKLDLEHKQEIIKILDNVLKGKCPPKIYICRGEFGIPGGSTRIADFVILHLTSNASCV